MGNGFRFIHCADLHLGSRFVGITDDDPVLGRRMRASIMESMSRIVDLALDRNVDFMVVSGDLYDEANVLPSTRLELCNLFRRLGRPVLISRGNHDHEQSWAGAIPYPDNVFEFPVVPSSIRMNIRGNRVEVVGVSFSGRRDDRNLVSMVRGRADSYTIACVHCDVDPSGNDVGYAPCSSRDLRGRNVDYWALGHIHSRSILSQSPLAVYPGNIQGRSIKESGEKGAYLVEVDSEGRARLEFHATQSIIWDDVYVDITGKDLSTVISEISEKVTKDSIVRITFSGEGDLDAMLRSEDDDIMHVIRSSCGCIVCEVRIDTVSAVDAPSLVGGGDMRSKVAEVGIALSRDRKTFSSVIEDSPVLSSYSRYFDSLDDSEVEDIIRSATSRVLSRMEVQR